jgi:hypothetical protein
LPSPTTTACDSFLSFAKALPFTPKTHEFYASAPGHLLSQAHILGIIGAAAAATAAAVYVLTTWRAASKSPASFTLPEDDEPSSDCRLPEHQSLQVSKRAQASQVRSVRIAPRMMACLVQSSMARELWGLDDTLLLLLPPVVLETLLRVSFFRVDPAFQEKRTKSRQGKLRLSQKEEEE